MSLFRCLYGRVSLIKSSCGEVYAFNISSKGSQSVVTHCLLFCNQKNLSQMTCSLKNKQPFEKVSVLSQSSSAPPLSLVENGNKERNSLVVDSWCSKKSVSEGYYRNKWKHKRSDKTNDNKNHDHAKCEFNFNSINVRLLETFGVIGTAVAVGIDVRSRINEWTPYQSPRGIHDNCHYHHHHFSKSGLNITKNVQQSLGVPRILEGFGRTLSPSTADSDDIHTIDYCGSCNLCSHVFNHLLHIYFAFPPLPTPSSILNVIPNKSTLAISYTSKTDLTEPIQAQTCDQRKTIINGTHSPNEIDQECVVEDLFSDSENEISSSSLLKFQDVADFQQKKKVRIDLDDAKLKSSTPIKSSTSNNFLNDKSPKTDSELSKLFKIASREYADQLNNIIGFSLMKMNRREEAMQCWASCNHNSRAFFNMGVAYEFGCYDKRDKPDLNRAHDCYAIASSMGHAFAIYNLSLFYLYGKGDIEVDINRAINLLKLAAQNGVEPAKNYMIEYERSRMEYEAQENLRKRTLANKTDLSRAVVRQSTSLFGKQNPKKHINRPKSVKSGGLRRVNSAPNLLTPNSGCNVE